MGQEQEQPRNKDLGIKRNSKPSIDFSRFIIPGAYPFSMPEELFPFGGKANKQRKHGESGFGALVKKVIFKARGERL